MKNTELRDFHIYRTVSGTWEVRPCLGLKRKWTWQAAEFIIVGIVSAVAGALIIWGLYL